ncbi:40S ribosomal protein S24-2 [Diplonema papillatum]|nr:40S ribosomal protein S24-2 [Diplonema papillatum]KAJ9460831.1 40S ribosomal protein S24-2 [Diplonema papillatum]
MVEGKGEGKIHIRTRKFMYNALLGRKQFVIDMTHTKRGTIPKTEVRTKIAEMYKVQDENCVSVFGFRNQFGGGKIIGFGLIYDTVAQAKKIEPQFRLIRAGLATKKESNRKQLKDRKNKAKKHRGLAKIRGPKKKKAQ